jgi:hypothetical protein
MTELKWEDPPASLQARNRRDWNSIANGLRTRPLEWAIVAENVSASTGTHIRHGRLTAFAPAGAFEARVSGARSEDGRASKVYARYVGSVKPEPSYESLPKTEPLEIIETLTREI